MAGESGSFGGYNNFTGYVNTGPALGAKTSTDKYGGYFRPGSLISDREKSGIVSRQQASAAKEAQQKKLDESASFLADSERQAESMQEGDIAFGSLGRNYPGDTRMAQTLKALGVAPDLMSAIIASAQLPPWGNR